MKEKWPSKNKHRFSYTMKLGFAAKLTLGIVYGIGNYISILKDGRRPLATTWDCLILDHKAAGYNHSRSLNPFASTNFLCANGDIATVKNNFCRFTCGKNDF